MRAYIPFICITILNSPNPHSTFLFRVFCSQLTFPLNKKKTLSCNCTVFVFICFHSIDFLWKFVFASKKQRQQHWTHFLIF